MAFRIKSLSAASSDFLASAASSDALGQSPRTCVPSSCGVSTPTRAGSSLSPRASPRGTRRPADAAAASSSRLFGSLAAAMPATAEHTQMGAFNRSIASDAELDARTRRVLLMERALLLLSGLQTCCALGFLLTINALPNGLGKLFLSLATGVTAVSGVFGFVGVARHSRPMLQWYFVSQVWALTQVVMQVVRSQNSNDRSHIFCAEVASLDASGSCLPFGSGFQIALLLAASVVVYTSVFVADALAEAYQVALETENQMLISHFVWMMRKNSLNSISRFEDLIHKQFEELVTLGYLKLKLG